MPTVLITGANRGIGLALTRHYATDGARVHACCRNPEDARDLDAVNGEVQIHALDTTDHGTVDALAAAIDEPIDIVIANAGTYGGSAQGQTFGNLDFDAMRHAFDVNTIGTLKTLKAFLPQVRRSEARTLVAISTKMASIADASGGVIAYRASKAALNMAMCCLAYEVKDEGVAVGTLHPGWVRTRMGGENALITTEESARGLAGVIANLEPGDKAPFKDYRGETIPW